MDEFTYNFNRICRTCKTESPNMYSMFNYNDLENTNENLRIDEMLMACTSLQPTPDDDLPNLICQLCIEELKNAYNFRQKCLLIDKELKDFAKNYLGKDITTTNIKQELNALIDNICNESINNIDNGENKNTDNKLPTIECKSDYIDFLENNQIVLTCRECNKVFTTLDGLKCHKRIHLGTLFKCKYCDKSYTRQTHVIRHQSLHGKHKLHVCRICNKTLTRIEHLKRHLTTHLKEKPYSCKRCGRGFNRSDHLDVHTQRCKGDRVHICDICNRGFIREDSLQVHKKLHENQTPCLPTLENIDNIEDHYYEIDFDPNMDDIDHTSDIDDYFDTTTHTDNNDEKKQYNQENIIEEKISLKIVGNDEDDDFDNDDNNDRGDNTLLQTNQSDCKESSNIMDNNDFDKDSPSPPTNDNNSESVDSEYFPTPVKKRGRGRPRKTTNSNYKTILSNNSKTRGRPRINKNDIKLPDEMELELKSELNCPSCNEVFETIKQLDKHLRKHDGLKAHTCKICSKQFARYNDLKRHFVTHSVLKPHICDTCGKKFTRRDNLNQHVKLHIKSEYECDICNRNFSKAYQLDKHKATKHNIGEKVFKEKKFECGVCLKTFTTEKYRDVHVRGHMGEKKYKCKICEKCFLSKSHLTEHMKFHNEHSKKYLCSECGQRFIRNDYLVIHMRRHRGEKPFKCKFCGKGFPRTTDLTVHERYHTGEKTHLCTICGRGFGRAYNLTVHMRTHTGEKPYQCTYCDAAFAQGNDLKAHVRRHTGERFHCELCTESFLMGYLLTQHKRTVHGLNVVSNIRRLQPISKIKQDSDDPPPITIPLPKPVVPEIMNNLHSHLAVQLQQFNE